MQMTIPAGNTPDWINSLFAAIDAKDAARFVQFLSPDAYFYFGNAPPSIGRAVIESTVANFFSAIRALKHELTAAWVVPGHVLCHGMVTYTRQNGTRLTVPFATVFIMEDERIRDYRIFTDASQLFA